MTPKQAKKKEFVRLCCVKGCPYRKRKNAPGPEVDFFKFPDWKKDCGPHVERMTRKRRIAWVSALKQPDVTFKSRPNIFVCSRHFAKGQPTWLDTDPDWAPSLHVGLTNIEESEDDIEEEPVKEKPKVRARRKKEPSELQIECCVANCESNTRKTGNVFHSFPDWRRGEGKFISMLTKKHREAWIAAIGRSDITFDNIPVNARVCSRHFVSGKPAYEMRQKHYDWAPSLHLNETKKPVQPTKPSKPKQPKESKESNQLNQPNQLNELPTPKKKVHKRFTRPFGSRRVKKKTTDQVVTVPKKPTASKRPNALQWKDLKSRLQTWMSDKPSRKQPTINTQTNTESEMDFKDFFKSSLEASLDACMNRAQSSTQTSLTLDLNWLSQNDGFLSSWKPPSLAASSVSCKNCDKLKENVEELEKKLAETSSEPKNQEQTVFPEWTMPLELEEQVTKSPPSQRTKPTFQLEWIKQHKFLRYSERLDLMWCHVCRLFAKRHSRHTAFVVGTRFFQLSKITQHSKTESHRECTKVFQARKRPQQM